LRHTKACVGVAAALVAAATGGLIGPVTPAAQAVASPSAQVVLDWNLNAVTAVRASTPAKFQIEGLIYMSYVQAAVYDAVTKIEGRYVPYHDFAADPTGASPEAAVVSAAYNTLVAYLGDPAGTLLAAYNASLAALPDVGRAEGVAVGKAASDDIVALRASDGRNAAIPTPYGAGPLTPGVWIFAPTPSAQSAQTPWVAFMKPLMLTSASQFRPDQPPSLLSRRYARDLNEVKAYGGDGITTPSARTPEQTAIAQFWNANAINADNQTLRDAASAHGMDLVDTARLLAMGVLVEADTGIACFDAKYAYTFWRPVTAIRNAGIDGNGRTEPDPKWTPLLTTPNHPEYPAAHGCLTAALGEVLAAGLGTRHINVDMPGATGGLTNLTTSRHYDTVKQLDREIINARVWAGLHYRNSGKVGVELGKDVAHWTLHRYFQPVGHESDDGHEGEGSDD
jgi:hypothetical protein